MLILGIILTIAGLAGTLYTRNEMASVNYAVGSFFGSDDASMLETIQMISIIVMVLGSIFLIIGIVKLATKGQKKAKAPLQPYYSPPVQNIAARPSAVTCSNCGQAMDMDAVFCVACGAKRQIAPAKNNDTPADVYVCAGCGQAIDKNTIFCGSCGAKR